MLPFPQLTCTQPEVSKLQAEVQARVRRNGILMALALRIVLLVAMLFLIDALADPFFVFAWEGVITGKTSAAP